MYTVEEIAKIKEIFDQYSVAERNLLNFCDQVVEKLGWGDSFEIEFIDDDILFWAKWHGPYGSHDTDYFSFPAAMLAQGVEVVHQHIKKELDKINQQRIEEEKKKKSSEELQEYLRLKKKYEGDDNG